MIGNYYNAYFAGRAYMIAAASIEKKKHLWFSFQYIHENRFIEAVKFYRAQLEFPADNSEEFWMLSENLRQRVININPSYIDFLHWLRRFDTGNRYKLRKRKERFVVAKNAMLFIHHCLKLILSEMETIALDVLVEVAERAIDDEE